MKKFLAILMAILMVLSMATVAFADVGTGDGKTTPTSVTLAKVVTVSEGATMPAETFTFKVENVSVSEAASGVTKDNMPTPSVDSVSYAKGESGAKDLTINYPSYTSVGKYTYKITENAGVTPGMTYDTNSRQLKVTVTNGANGGFEVKGTVLEDTDNKKSDSFQNKYEAGKLEIKKFVSGDLGDQSKFFDFTVTLKSSKAVSESLVKNGNEDVQWVIKDGEYVATVSIKLKHGDTATITNIPYTVAYTVVENGTTNTAAEGETPVYKNSDYTVTMTNESGTIKALVTTATFNNNKEGDIETGVSLDTLPYVLVLALAGAGLVLMIARKRRVQD